MGLEGKLTDMPVLDLMRIFQRGARSGKLVLWTEGAWALVWLLEGQAVGAMVLGKPDRRPLHSGEHAFFHLFTWSEGHFRYSPAPAISSYPANIKRPTGALIVEALRHRPGGPRPTAWGELALQTPLCLLPQMMGSDEQLWLSAQEWMVLIRIGQRSTAQELAAQTGLAAEQVLAIVAHLIDCGLVMPVPLDDLPQRRLTVELPRLAAGSATALAPITNLTRAIRRRLQQIAVGA